MSPNPPRCTTRRRINAIALSKLIVTMQDMPCTYHDLVDATGLNITTIRHYLLALHKEGGCYICGWEKNSRGIDCTPVFSLGRGRDKPRERKSDAARNRTYRAKKAQIAMLHAMAGGQA